MQVPGFAAFCSNIPTLLRRLSCSGLTGARPEGTGRGWVWLSFLSLPFLPALSFLSYCHVMFFPWLAVSCPLLALSSLSCPVLSFCFYLASHAPTFPWPLPFPSLLISCPFLSLSFPFFALPISSLGFIMLFLHSPFLFVLSCHDCSLHPIASLSFSCLSFPPLSLLFPKSFSFSILPLSLSCSCSPPRPFPCPVLSLSPFPCLLHALPPSTLPRPQLLDWSRPGGTGRGWGGGLGFSFAGLFFWHFHFSCLPFPVLAVLCFCRCFLSFLFVSFLSFPFLVFPSLALSCLRFPPFPSLAFPSLPLACFCVCFCFHSLPLSSSPFLSFPFLSLPFLERIAQAVAA